MKYRELGSTGIKVSTIGFGAWGIGGVTPGATSYGETDDKTSLDALSCAKDKGINFYDTSNVYGAGHSEKLLAGAFKKVREQVVFATKAGLLEYGKPVNFSQSSLINSVEGSLQRLQTDYIDLLQLHNVPQQVIDRPDEVLDVIQSLKKKGKIRAFGVSVQNPVDGLAVINRFSPDSIQVNINLLDMRASICGLTSLAVTKKVSLIARTPLCFGFLSGQIAENTFFPPQDHRSRWSQNQIVSWIKAAQYILAAVATTHGENASQFALRYCLSVPGVATVIPGIMNKKEALENSHAGEIGELTKEEMEKISTVYLQKVQPILENSDGSGMKKPPDPGKISS
ncbi:MAG: aldo/keto reductase [Magnetococcales bacterium]|nr:aldo/keto reductase [Magnetococcales bacterium]